MPQVDFEARRQQIAREENKRISLVSKSTLEADGYKVLPDTNPYRGKALDAVLETDEPISGTKVSGTKINSTDSIESVVMGEVSSTNADDTISSTKVSGTNFMNAYKRKKYDTLRVDFPKGTKERFREEAAKRGISVTKMIQFAMERYLKEG